ncbi:methionine adenosyltransferase domain-containing protein [Candidatus Woesearchaeota archaeon]|nr:methionine adenosyltransferase domain-containing protein [Candidatus Woesearchaeota archaeon]
MAERIVHSFEAGRRGKPDELESIIASSIGGFLLTLNPNSRFDLDVSGDYIPREDLFLICIGGELSPALLDILNLKSELSKRVSLLYNIIHRTSLGPEKFKFVFNFKQQEDVLASNGEAGDIGNPIAVAYRYGPTYEPWERFLAVETRDLIDDLFYGGLKTYAGNFILPHIRNGINSPKIPNFPNHSIGGLGADGKVAVDVEYDGNKPSRITNLTVCIEHEPTLSIDDLRAQVTPIILSYFNQLHSVAGFGKIDEKCVHINPLGAWNRGGWIVDSGNREAKPYRDGFASYGCCEDSFSGEDPSKPSGTGTFLARYIAVQVVGNGLADFSRVALTYTAGSKDVGLNITTNGTARIGQNELEAWVRRNIPLGINDAISRFSLRNSNWYTHAVQASDFFHSPEFPWNKFEVKYK